MRELHRAREQVKAMVNDDASLPQIKAYLNQWGQMWQKTSSTWNYKERSHAYIKSCWDPFAAKMAAFAFQQNYFTELCSSELIALVA